MKTITDLMPPFNDRFTFARISGCVAVALYTDADSPPFAISYQHYLLSIAHGKILSRAKFDHIMKTVDPERYGSP